MKRLLISTALAGSLLLGACGAGEPPPPVELGADTQSDFVGPEQAMAVLADIQTLSTQGAEASAALDVGTLHDTCVDLLATAEEGASVPYPTGAGGEDHFREAMGHYRLSASLCVDATAGRSLASLDVATLDASSAAMGKGTAALNAATAAL